MTPVNLDPDDCEIYKYWSKYFQELNPSSVGIIKGGSVDDVLATWDQTKRHSLRQSIKKGYESRVISWQERNEHLDDIHAINVSLPIRQRKPMAKHYQDYPHRFDVAQTCENHKNTFIGCFFGPKLRAYISVNVCGEIIAASQIIGHGDYLKDGIMLSAWWCFVRYAIEIRSGFIVYSRWRDGHDGLRSWKAAVGLKPIILYEK